MEIKIIKVFTIFLVLAFFNNISSMGPGISPNQLLIDSAATGDLEGVKNALEQGADVYYQGGKYRESRFDDLPAIFYACERGHLNIVEFLVKSGFDPNFVEARNYTLLDFAIWNKHTKIFEYLIKKNLTNRTRIVSYFSFYGSYIPQLAVWHGVTPSRLRYEKNIRVVIQDFDLKLKKWLSERDRQIKELSTVGRDSEEGLRIIESLESIKSTILSILDTQAILKKFALRLANLENKSFKDIVKKANQVKKNKLKNKINGLGILPHVIEDMVVQYSLYPENFEDFFKLSDYELDDLVKTYSEEFEKKERAESCLIM